ncbi:MAG: tetratricopeptide repeat protein [Rikenellaceae bacterium]|nr:tetratricopeptide repeat protein [Rikenellaceae bacterium]
MAKKANIKEQAPEQVIDNALVETESYFEKNWKKLTIALVVVLLAVGGWFVYSNVYVKGESEKASSAMFVAQQLFAEEQWENALNGDGTCAGFLEIIENYGNTPEGNIANYYAGICYFKSGDMENAKKYLAEYSATKGSPNTIINAQCYGLQGDILTDEGNYTEAVEMYKKAVEAADNVLTTATYLKKMGLVYEAMENYTEALNAYETIKENYPTSIEGRDIQKYIGTIEQKLQ